MLCWVAQGDVMAVSCDGYSLSLTHPFSLHTLLGRGGLGHRSIAGRLGCQENRMLERIRLRARDDSKGSGEETVRQGARRAARKEEDGRRRGGETEEG